MSVQIASNDSNHRKKILRGGSTMARLDLIEGRAGKDGAPPSKVGEVIKEMSVRGIRSL